METAIVLFLRKYWLYIVVAVAVAAWHGVVYYAGGAGPRAELEKERALHSAEVAALKAEQAADRQASEALIARKDEEHEANVGRINSEWGAYLDGLCPRGVERGVCLGPVRRPATEPVRIRAEVCNDEAGNNRLSDALQVYRTEVGRSVQAERDEHGRVLTEERRSAGALLAACQRQADALVNLQEAWAEERGINATPAIPEDVPIPGRIH